MNATSSRARLVVLLASSLVLGTAGTAHAQPHTASDVAQARELFNQAMTQRDQGDVPGALERFKAAHALVATPITGVELGRTYISVGKLVEAREVLLSIGRIPAQAAETARSSAARKEADTLAEQIRTRIPSLTVKITGVPVDSVAVTIDGAAVPTAALIAPRLVDPGPHQVVATSTTGGHAETTVDLKEGQSRDVELTIVLTGGTPPVPPVAPPPPGPDQPPPASEAQGSSGMSPLVYVGFGTGATGIAVGSITGLLSLSKASSVKNACDGLTCPRSVDGDLQSGRTLGTVSTIAFAVGAAGVVVGVVGLVLKPHKEAAPAASVNAWVGPGSMGLAGRF
jgi:hypothetical protein